MVEVGIYNQSEEDVLYLDIVKEIIEAAMKKEGVEASCNIIITTDEYLHFLNKNYRHIDKATDVITFALEDDDVCILPSDIRILGDIYISIETAKRQALEYQHSLKRELCFLAVHGFYHLLGYDHMTKEEEEVMFKKQEEVLDLYGIER